MTRAQTAQNDVPLPLALMVLVGFGLVYLYLAHLRLHPDLMQFALQQLEANAKLFWITISCAMVNISFVSIYLKRSIGLEKQGSKLAVLEGKSRHSKFGRAEFVSIVTGAATYFACRKQIADFIGPIFLRFADGFQSSGAVPVLSANIAFALGLVVRMFLRGIAKLKFSFNDVHKLDAPEIEEGELVLGTTPGQLTHSVVQNSGESEDWVKIPSRGLNGGIMISGSIGSGKTQGTVLRYLRQILRAGENSPAILAIDPKRTFLVDAEKIIRRSRLGDKIFKISLRA